MRHATQYGKFQRTLIVCVLTFAVGACSRGGCGSDKPRDVETLKIVRGRFVNPADGNPFSGAAAQYYKNGALSARMCVEEGQVGALTTYFMNGDTAGTGSLRDGEWVGRASGGQEIARGKFVNYQKDGMWLEPVFDRETYDPVSDRLESVPGFTIIRDSAGKMVGAPALHVSMSYRSMKAVESVYYFYPDGRFEVFRDGKLSKIVITDLVDFGKISWHEVATLTCDDMQYEGIKAEAESKWPAQFGSFAENMTKCGSSFSELRELRMDDAVAKMVPQWLSTAIGQ